jgi:hypothetical protein
MGKVLAKPLRHFRRNLPLGLFNRGKFFGIAEALTDIFCLYLGISGHGVDFAPVIERSIAAPIPTGARIKPLLSRACANALRLSEAAQLSWKARLIAFISPVSIRDQMTCAWRVSLC